MSHKTLEANSIPIPPHLAGLLKQNLGKKGTGFDEGAFLQQLHYWTLNPATTGWIINGTKWIYNSLKVWQAQFPWMSEYGLRKAIANLKQLGLIQTVQHGTSQYKRVMFDRIDYDRLSTFAADLCDLITPRCVTSDRVDVPADRTTHTDTASDTSLAEQQTSVALTEAVEASDRAELPTYKADAEEKSLHAGVNNHAAPSSGKNSDVQNPKFPELVDAVAQAVNLATGSSLPASLKDAIVQFPERVKMAIAYLQDQQQKRQIKNPVGYLYEAIMANWNLSILRSSVSVLPDGFREWFDWAKVRGWVSAATTIDGIHHTLHTHHGWLPTSQIMQAYSSTMLLE